MKKTIRNIITIVLVAALSMSLLSAVAFADTSKKLLILGDSTAKLFAEDVKGYTVAPIIADNFRPYDIYNVLDTTFDGEDTDVVEAWAKVNTGYNAWKGYNPGKDVNDFLDEYFASHIKPTVQAVDVIAYDVGMDNLGSYLFERLVAVLNQYVGPDGTQNHTANKEYLAKYGDDTIDNILPHASKSVATLISSFRASVMNVLNNRFGDNWNKGSLEAIKVTEMVDSVAYAFASYIIYFDKSIESIMELKKDSAQLVVFGLYNAYQDEVINLVLNDDEGTKTVTIPVGTIFGLLVDAINTYITQHNEYSGEFKFANLVDNDVYTNLDYIKAGNSDWLENALEEYLKNEAPASPMSETEIKKAFGIVAKKQFPNGNPIILCVKEGDNGFNWSTKWENRFDVITKIYNGEEYSPEELTPLYIWMLYACLDREENGMGTAYKPNNSKAHVKAFENALNSKFAANGYAFDTLVNKFNDKISGSGTILGALIKTVLDSQASFAERAAKFFQNFNTVTGFISKFLKPIVQ